jgi:iron complex outermembrane recepter protein
LDFDLTARYVDNLMSFTAYATHYIEMDVRLAWRPTKHLELAVVGQNLLNLYHIEDKSEDQTHGGLWREDTAVPRSVYGTAAWRY